MSDANQKSVVGNPEEFRLLYSRHGCRGVVSATEVSVTDMELLLTESHAPPQGQAVRSRTISRAELGVWGWQGGWASAVTPASLLPLESGTWRPGAFSRSCWLGERSDDVGSSEEGRLAPNGAPRKPPKQIFRNKAPKPKVW
ncbi:hypothetical protein E4U43_002234 [Claviceps pusilla]|uniref:Uncharacterized protein n=1 Tax=Claviceps pusilla TaxID=123648 RepID=A0A9P7NFZ5_9HYPO|nr:hypothetical protein E4U43_002234 [Claviceps pusilla]